MKLITFPIIHLGTDKTKEVLANMYDTLRNRGVNIIFDTEVEDILTKTKRLSVVRTSSGDFLKADYVVVAVGRSGADDLTRW